MTTKNRRYPPAARVAELLKVAVLEAEKRGLANLKRVDVAVAAGVSEALVSARLGTMINLRRSVMRQAIAEESLRIVAEGLACRDPVALKAPEALRMRAAQSMAHST